MRYVDGMDSEKSSLNAKLKWQMMIPETLALKVKQFEHILYPLVIDAIASGDFSSLNFG